MCSAKASPHAAIRTGPRRTGQSPLNPDAAAIFNRAMAQTVPARAASLVSYDWRARHTVADIGGGNGTLLAQLLTANDHLHGTVVDLPHAALRMYVMGKRALSEAATEQDMATMARTVQEALKAGALGFSSSRASTHLTPDDTPVASRLAEWEEIERIMAAMAELDDGIFQVGPDIASGARHRVFLDRLRQIALKYKRPIMFGVLATRQGDNPNVPATDARFATRDKILIAKNGIEICRRSRHRDFANPPVNAGGQM